MSLVVLTLKITNVQMVPTKLFPRKELIIAPTTIAKAMLLKLLTP
ncbi:MAG: hypothetical protein BWY30_01181 [Tenericutes bacterium ADurb.Bin239]|nr:MAG: hypothetical protein BWY30_01181 [Tenericutes bacterium ADurb.Bin239]